MSQLQETRPLHPIRVGTEGYATACFHSLFYNPSLLPGLHFPLLFLKLASFPFPSVLTLFNRHVEYINKCLHGKVSVWHPLVSVIESRQVKNMSKRLTLIKIAIKHIFPSDVSLRERKRETERRREGYWHLITRSALGCFYQ